MTHEKRMLELLNIPLIMYSDKGSLMILKLLYLIKPAWKKKKNDKLLLNPASL